MAGSIGFIGIGTINSAVITGLCTLDDPPKSIVLSPRNKAKAAALAQRFPNVTVAASNQEVLDQCTYVFVAVLGAQAEGVLSNLTFRPEHTVVSLVAGVSRPALQKLMPAVDPENLVVAVPLPPVKDHAGVTLVTPTHPRTVALFESLGGCVPVDEQKVMSKLQIVTCLMGAYYGFLRSCHEWLIEQGVPSATASKFAGGIMYTIASDGKNAGEHGFGELIDEQTPGGMVGNNPGGGGVLAGRPIHNLSLHLTDDNLISAPSWVPQNEQGIRELTDSGVWEEIKATMTSIDHRWS